MTTQMQQGLDVSKSLETLCKKNDRCSSELQGFLAKQVGDDLEVYVVSVNECHA